MAKAPNNAGAAEKPAEERKPKVTLAKRISTRSLVGVVNVDRYPDDHEPAEQRGAVIPGRSRDLYSVVGIARKIRTGETDKGPWKSFIGDFMAILPSGDRTRAGQLFLPDVAGDLVENEMAQMPPGASGIQLGFTVGIKSDATAATGYVYTAEPLIEAAPSDPLMLLANQVAKGETIQRQDALTDQTETA